MSKRRTSLLDDLQHLFLMVPWWVGPIVAVAVYTSFKFGIPLYLDRQMQHADNPNTEMMHKTLSDILGPVAEKVAPLIAGVIILVWIVSLMQKYHRRRIFRNTRAAEDVRALSWQQFEHIVGEYYRQRGYLVEEHGGSQPDGGIDLVLRKGTHFFLVQCKHWKTAKVGVRPVRELCGVMNDAGAHGGILVTSGIFSDDARAFAEKNRIDLVDGDELFSMLHATRQSARGEYSSSPGLRHRTAIQEQDTAVSPSCPLCGSTMVLRTAHKGAYAGSRFYGCPQYPACKGIRSL